MNLKILLIQIVSQCLWLAAGLPVKTVELREGWQLNNQAGNVTRHNLTIPSGVYSAFKTKPEDDILFSYNDIKLRWLGSDNWTYKLNVNVDQIDFNRAAYIYLTFFGIDTISDIYVNGGLVGSTDNMFVRYSFNIKKKLKSGENKIEVVIKSPIKEALKLAEKLGNPPPPACTPFVYNGECHMNLLRKMQASFGWDWGLAAPSMGIWKPVVMEYFQTAIIRDISVNTVSKNNGSWDMNVRVYLDSPARRPFYVETILYVVELLKEPKKVNAGLQISPNNTVIEFTETFDNVEVWWPNGYGEQKLYAIHVDVVAYDTVFGAERAELSRSSKSVRVGFRKIELVQEKLSNGNSFYFKVNDLPIFMKGSNYIPSHILPEKSDNHERIDFLLKSAMETHQNMIRVWGGGIYESDYFYDMADYYGILIWQDMMFACALYPVNDKFLDSVRIEVRQNTQRIIHHPSIAIIATNNENEMAIAGHWWPIEEQYFDEYRQLYVKTVRDEIYNVIKTDNIEVLVSSPSNGILSEQENYLSNKPNDNQYGDIHFYDITINIWNPLKFPNPRFSSEYGTQSIPPMRSWSLILDSNDSISDLMDHRQHSPLRMEVILPQLKMNLPLPLSSDKRYIEALCYMSQISQAMGIKTQSEVYRVHRDLEANTMGALYWQLNDVWIAPSWSSIDFFGVPKILWYWSKDFFAPIAIIAQLDNDLNQINVTISREERSMEDFNGFVEMKLYKYGSFQPEKEFRWEVVVKSNSNKYDKVVTLRSIIGSTIQVNNYFVFFKLFDKHNNNISNTWVLLNGIKYAIGVKDPEINFELSKGLCKNTLNMYTISIMTNYPAFFVYIEITNLDIRNYKLSKNGFLQLSPITVVHLEFESENCIEINKKDVKILTINEFMNKY